MLALSPDIYAWLVSIDVLDDSLYDPNKEKLNTIKFPQYPNLPASVVNFSFNENGSVNLSKDVNQSILTGYFFLNIFSKFNILMNEIYGNIYKHDQTLNQVINNDTPQIKLHNWEVILESIKNYYGIIFDENFKTLLVAGDNTTFNELFQKLYTFYLDLQSRIEKENETKFLKENKQTKLENPVFDNDKTKELPKVRFNEDIVDLDELAGDNNQIKPLIQTRSVLEFIIVAICKSMSLTAKQSAALLSDNKKYLTHILIKGLSQKNFEPVKMFYQEILGNIDYFMQLIQINSIAYPNQISKNIELSLNTFKPGLLSKNLDVVYITGRLLSKFALELIENNLISPAWDWFVSPGGGLETCLLLLKKHDDAIEIVVTLINNFARFHLFEFFTIYLKQFLQNDGAYFTFVSDIIEKFGRLSNFTDEFSKNHLKEFFLEYIIEVSHSPNTNEKMKAALFLGEIWVNFSIYFTDEAENFQILSIFKTLYKDKNHLVQYCSLCQLFRSLEVFVSERNKFVSVIYKCLIFMFIEYHNDLNIREFLLSNFNEVFKNILSIPVGIMVEPYVKQVQYNLGNSYYFNVNDVSFLTTVARHPRFNVKEAILVLDVLGKILFDIGKEENVFQSEALKTNVYRGIYFYKIVDNLFMMILSRFLMHEVGIQFIFKYVKMILETYCRLDKDLSEKIYLNALILNVNPEEEKKKLIFEEDIILNDDVKNNRINFISLEKMIIVMMIQDILNINNTFINNVIKSLLLICCLQHFKIYNFHNIGLSKMLSHFGEPNDIVYYYNVNRDEYDIDKDFEFIIKQIYDKLPEVKEKEFNTESDNSKRTITNNTSRKKNIYLKKDSNVSTKSNELLKLNTNQIYKLKNIKDNIKKNKKNNVNKDLFEHEKLQKYTDNNKTLITNETYFRNNVTNNRIELLDLNNEEDRDLIKLKKFLKDYAGFFKNVFMKYCGSIYSPIQGKVFNSIKEIGDTISPSEVVKIFREHGVLNKEISKEDLLMIVGNMNTKIFKKKSIKAGITYDEFIEDFIQISYHSFVKPPFVYKYFSISDYAEEMIKLFRKENPENLKYYHPDQILSNDEKEVCNSFNKKLMKTDLITIPKNFHKYLNTEILFNYKVPDCMYFVLGESKKICLEIIDEVINKVTGTHCLEGFCFVKEVYKVRPNHPKKEYPRLANRELYEKEKINILKDRNKKKPFSLGKLKENTKYYK